MKKYILFLITIVFFSSISYSQTIHENSGWLSWFNTYQFSKKFGVTSDVQFRSADHFQYVRNVLIRSGLTYHFNTKNNISAGYAYIGSFNKLPAPSKNNLTEHRIWEQYIHNIKFNQVSLQNRLRLEQRFIERQTDKIFAQRLRYFVRTVIPIVKQEEAFAEGFFAAVQNEVFLNIQNKKNINNSLFDQNRLYAAVGYRLSPKLDVETGYLNQYINGASADVSNNIIQLVVYTRF